MYSALYVINYGNQQYKPNLVVDYLGFYPITDKILHKNRVLIMIQNENDKEKRKHEIEKQFNIVIYNEIIISHLDIEND